MLPLSPRITFAVLAYNQERFIGDAVRAALAQTHTPLEVILSDDCSKDRTFEVMRRIAADYNGPHQVHLRQSKENRGWVAHLSQVVDMATGDLIILAAGDDISLPNRATDLVGHWERIGRPTAVLYSDFMPIDTSGQPLVVQHERVFRGTHTLAGMARGQIHILGATLALTKDIFTSFPSISPSVFHEDRVIPFRAALLGGALEFVDQKLVAYRVEGGMSRNQVTSGNDFLLRVTPYLHARMLPDAAQRLLDLFTAGRATRDLRRMCLSTIVDHESKIAFAESAPHKYELIAATALARGARLKPLINHYFKFRFRRLYNFYWAKKNKSRSGK